MQVASGDHAAAIVALSTSDAAAHGAAGSKAADQLPTIATLSSRLKALGLTPAAGLCQAGRQAACTCLCLARHASCPPAAPCHLPQAPCACAPGSCTSCPPATQRIP
jgi:hypothetical protein